MRRLLVIVCAIVLVDTMLYAALAPLLPSYADEYGLSKTGAGILVAAFGVGALVGAVPSGIVAARVGTRVVLMTGLAVMSFASIGFAFAGDASMLGATRFLQGLGSAFSWTGAMAWLAAVAPVERRGEMIGVAIAAAVVGALLGPVLGGAAGVVGSKPVFGGIAAVGLGLLAVSSRMTDVHSSMRLADLGRGFRNHELALGLWLIALPAMLFGGLAVLAPLHLGTFGWEAPAIGGVFLAAASLEASLAPVVGRASDRLGRSPPIRVALVTSAVVAVALAAEPGARTFVVLVVLAGGAFGALYAPATALVSDASERAGIPVAFGFGIANAAWALGTVTGPALGGALAEFAGDRSAYLVMALGSLLTFAAVRSRGTGAPALAGRADRRDLSRQQNSA